MPDKRAFLFQTASLVRQVTAQYGILQDYAFMGDCHVAGCMDREAFKKMSDMAGEVALEKIHRMLGIEQTSVEANGRYLNLM
jgi:hypothetical protein